MQNKKIDRFVLIPINLDVLIESGLDLEGVLQTYTSDGRIIIENVFEFDDFVCDTDCESCPCISNCEDCEEF